MGSPAKVTVIISIAILHLSSAGIIQHGECPQIWNVNNGEIKTFQKDNQLVYAYNCNNGFKPSCPQMVFCNNGQWDFPEPSCLITSEEKTIGLAGNHNSNPTECEKGQQLLTDKNGASACISINEVQSIQSAQSVPSVQTYQTIQPVQNYQTIQPAQTYQTIQPVQNYQTIQPAQTYQTIQPVQTYQTVQPVQSYQNVQSSSFGCVTGQQQIVYNGRSQCLDVSNMLQMKNGQFQIITQPQGPITCQFNCNQGYTLVGQQEMSYQQNQWIGVVPTCVQMPLRNIHQGSVQCFGGNRYVFKCLDGYVLHGNSEILMENNRMNGVFPSCVPKMDLTLANGEVRVDMISQGYNLVYKCKEGYELVGNGEFVSADGQTVKNKPVCVPKMDCPILSIDKGFVETNNQSNTATFGCCEGYELIGETFSVCKNGKWSNAVPKCTPLCEKINLLNGEVVFNSETKVASFSCNENFYLKGNSESTCVDGKWTKETPTCLPYCSALNVPNAQIYSNEQKDIFNVVCNANFTLRGNKELACNYGQWSHPFPVCVGECQSLHINFGVSMYNDDRTVVKFICNAGYALIGIKETTCIGGTWSNPIPRCVPACQSVNTQNGMSFDSQMYNCNTGFNIVG